MPFFQPEDDGEEDSAENSHGSGAPSAKKPNFSRLRTLTSVRDNAKVATCETFQQYTTPCLLEKFYLVVLSCIQLVG